MQVPVPNEYCLVSRHFSSIATQFLYRELVLDDSEQGFDGDDVKMNRIMLPPARDLIMSKYWRLARSAKMIYLVWNNIDTSFLGVFQLFDKDSASSSVYKIFMVSSTHSSEPRRPNEPR